MEAKCIICFITKREWYTDYTDIDQTYKEKCLWAHDVPLINFLFKIWQQYYKKYGCAEDIYS